MGEVFLADDTQLSRKVAIKFLSEALEADDSARQRLHREARSAAALDHPYICNVHEIAEVDGRSGIVMEHVSGETLHARLRRAPLSTMEALRIAGEIAEALSEAHKRRVVHRDLKPSNVMLTEQGHVKVMDFGLAKQAPSEQADTITPLTQAGVRVGTPAYMSPEQLLSGAADERSDIFAFGILLYELLAGVHPFTRSSQSGTMTAIVQESPAPVRQYAKDAPEAVGAALDRLLAKDPRQRYQSLAEVRVDLAHLSDVAGHAPPAQTSEPGRLAPTGRRMSDGRPSARSCGGSSMAPSPARARSSSWVGSRASARRGWRRKRWPRRASGGVSHSPAAATKRRARRHSFRGSRSSSARPGSIRAWGFARCSAMPRPRWRSWCPSCAACSTISRSQSSYRRSSSGAICSTASSSSSSEVRAGLHTPCCSTTCIGRTSPPYCFRHFAQQLGQMPLLIIGTYRDVDLDVERPFAEMLETLTRQRLAHKMALGRLSEGGVGDMLRVLSDQDPPAALAKAVYAETEGNPFFTEEVFHHLSEAGRIFDEAGKWRTDLRFEDLEVPEGVRLVIVRRVKRLSDAARGVLASAAIVGRSFDIRLLEALGDTAGELILATRSGREPRWEFAHGLIRQTLENSLSLMRRQRAHLRVAEAMERVYGDRIERHAPDVAQHLYQAGVAADPGKAVRFLTLAGDQSLEAGAFDEALRLFGDALSIQEEEDDRRKLADLHYKKGLVLRSLGRFPEAVDALQPALAVFEELHDLEGSPAPRSTWPIRRAGSRVERVRLATSPSAP